MPAASTSPTEHQAAIYAGGRLAFASGAAATDAIGVPRQRFVKDLIRVGEYVAGGIRHTVSLDRLRHWAATFGKMKAAGIEVPMPVEHTTDPEKRRGTVLSMFVEGDTLKAECEMVGEDGIRLAHTTKVSVYAPAFVQGGDGTKWHDAIEHVALTDYPVVPGQAGSRDAIPVVHAATQRGCQEL